MNNNKIGSFIQKLRKKKGLTQQELGNLLYVTDKAVSKWERGLSLPDITILSKLADILEVTVEDILNGEITKKKNIDIDKTIEEATKQIILNNKQKQKKIIIIISIIILLLVYTIFRNLHLGYTTKTINYHYQTSNNLEFNIGVPKISFMNKNRDYSYSYKNLRNHTVIEKEIKDYLKTLKYLTCNDTIYYYNELENYSIIEYNIKNNYLYTTISYSIINDDYCNHKKINKYQEKLGHLRKMYVMTTASSSETELKNKLYMTLIDGGDNPNKYEFKIELKVLYYDNQGNLITLEHSIGNYEIKEDKLIYYRKEIKEKSNNIKIPDISIFTLKYKYLLILDDNYLYKYADEIKLK